MRQSYFSIALLGSLSLLTAGCGSTGGDETPTSAPGADEVCRDYDGDTCILQGSYTGEITLTADQEYLLEGAIFVGSDDGTQGILNIDPGVTIKGGPLSFLTVRQGSQIFAEGERENPIVFTSFKAEGERATGDWGGLILNGYAPINFCSGDVCQAEGEGGTGVYGGDQPMDDSGVLRYVRVEFAGYELTEENQLNGVAFQGVGAGTTVDYLHVHRGADDGVEFYGGTVNAKHLLITGAEDDAFDWTFGWTGNVQYVVVQQYAAEGERGIEADNNENDFDAAPRSMPTISNMTLIGASGSTDSDVGLKLRRGTGAHIYNTIVMDFADGCLNIDDDATFTVAGAGDLTISNSIFDCAAGTVEKPEEDSVDLNDWLFTTMVGNEELDPQLVDPTNEAAPNFAPADGSPALSGGEAPSGADFEAASFRGAIGSEDWTTGAWTSFPTN